MDKFIEVTVKEDKRLINTSWIEEIWEMAEGTDIYFACNPPNAIFQDMIHVEEEYTTIKRKVCG